MKYCKAVICIKAMSTTLAFKSMTWDWSFLRLHFFGDIYLRFCSNLWKLDFATASLIHLCLSKIFAAPIGFAQRISQPSESAIPLDPIL